MYNKQYLIIKKELIMIFYALSKIDLTIDIKILNNIYYFLLYNRNSVEDFVQNR